MSSYMEDMEVILSCFSLNSTNTGVIDSKTERKGCLNLRFRLEINC